MYNENYINEEPIFDFINPNQNDTLSKMNGFDLQDFIILMDDFSLQLRNKIGFNKDTTFGLELEFEHIIDNEIGEELRKTFPNGDWKITYDSSLNHGLEINSPILTDKQKNWKNLNKVCSIIRPSASIGRNSGGHIHIGTKTLGDNVNSWLNFIKLWSVYENIIYRFVYGNFLTARPSMDEYAQPLSKTFWNDYKFLKESHASLDAIIHKISHYTRYQAVNFENVFENKCHKFYKKNTIEFRCPNGSLDAVIWQNNVNLFVKLLRYSKSSSYHHDIIQKRHKLNSNKFSELKWYNEIYLDQALEFCDMIFDNNLDKIYFLKQYLKSMQICKDNANYPKECILRKK